MPRRAKKALLVLIAGMASLVLVAAVAIYVIGVSGVGSERLRIEAERSIEKFAGVDIVASVGPARITLDASRFLALEVRDVSLKYAGDGAGIVDAGLVRFGIRLFPLLSGKVSLSSARLSDARIVVPALSLNEGADWSAALRGADGLISPDRIIKIVFASARRVFKGVSSDTLRRITLKNVDLVLSNNGGAGDINVANAVLSEKQEGNLGLSAEFEFAGRRMAVEASAVQNSTSKRITDLVISAKEAVTDTVGLTAAPDGNRVGMLGLALTGSEGGGANPASIRLAVQLKNSGIDLGKHGILVGDLDVRGQLVEGSKGMAIERLRTIVGRSVFDFRGVVEPGETDDGATSYRYELASARSIVAPGGSPEPAVNASIRVKGHYSETSKSLTADDIILKAGRGEVLGTASLQLVDGGAPGMAAAFSVHDAPVSLVKQLWPWFSADKARNWVMQNLFGGRIVDAQLQFQVEPRRLGNGVPLSGAEVFGTFAVEGTRFDTAGLIPPIRDATGVVDFRANDVDITLSSGTVFLPSGRTVAAKDGTLTVRKANIPPVIGLLDIDVAGDAAAVAELASYDPINAMRFVGMPPQDFSGDVTGHVTADIPLHKGIDVSKLNWSVALDYANLSIAKPVDGQMVTEAAGTIVVDRTKATIVAKAKLSGVAAEIDAVEPVGKDGPERRRTVTMTLDDKARETLAPGLSEMIKGPVKIVLDAKGGGKQLIKADLTNAELDIPWAGWSKGAGIASEVSFAMDKTPGGTSLSDFDLAGATFGIKGAIDLSQGSLAEAKLSSVKLNRDDDFAVSIKRTGSGGYAVNISGDMLDARSAVRQFTKDTDTATKATDSGSISVRVDVKTVTGFNSERFSNVKLDYSGSGDKLNGLVVTATASSGAAVEMRNGSEAGTRSMRMQSDDAGAILRFLDIYEHMEGGKIALSLSGASDGPMTGQVDARDFFVVNEPRLNSIVSTRPPGDSRSLNEAVKREIDTSRVKFERGFTQITKGDGDLKLTNGVLRGPAIGATFQGTFYDKQGNMDMTGTFMPAYGLNRLFGEIPIVGLLLGNGRDRGLIGVTFKLEGDADSPNVSINPLSVIAPGIFRSIFEYQ